LVAEKRQDNRIVQYEEKSLIDQARRHQARGYWPLPGAVDSQGRIRIGEGGGTIKDNDLQLQNRVADFFFFVADFLFIVCP
jgi:hypothetical protein